MDFRTFWYRIILRRKNVPGAAARPKAAAPVAPPPTQAKAGVGFTTGVAKLDEQHHHIREAILGFQKDLGRGLAAEDLVASLDALLQLREHLAVGDQGASLDLSAFLFNWFRKHTLEEDATFAKPPRRP